MLDNVSDMSIKRVEIDKSEGSFFNLKKQGIQLLQDLSGRHWTDFNDHDPGVTILEQLCFGLTELSYLSDLEPQDILANSSGGHDWDQLALHRPETALSSRATTLTDHRLVLLDAGIQDVDNLWVEAVPGANNAGVYTIRVQTCEQLIKGYGRDCKLEAICRDIYKNWCKQRNLGEDIAEIIFVKPSCVTILADVDITRSADVDEILAQIYYLAETWLSPKAEYQRYSQLLEQGLSTEDIFKGPLSSQGFFNDAAQETGLSLSLSGLKQRVCAINGVEQLNALKVKFSDELEGKDESKIPLWIKVNLPTLEGDHLKKVVIKRRGSNTELLVDRESMLGHFNRLYLKEQSQTENMEGDINRLFPMPEGQSSRIEKYESLQRQFPLLYGLQDRLDQKSKNGSEIAKIKQLKGYLMIFEQLMANFKGNITGIKTLFSTKSKGFKTDDDLSNTYQFLPLTEENFQGASLLYADDWKDRLKKIKKEFDPFEQRVDKVLNYLLSLYGETYEQKILSSFHDYYNRDKLVFEKRINKVDYLTHIIPLTRDRAEGLNYSQSQFIVSSSPHISVFQHRIRAFLGMKPMELKDSNRWTQSMIKAMCEQGVRIISNDAFKKRCEAFLLNSILQTNSDHFKIVDCISETEKCPDYQRGVVEMMKPFSGKTKEGKKSIMILPEKLLSSGINLKNYRFAQRKNSQCFALVLHFDEHGQWLYLNDYSSESKVTEAANALRYFLMALNLSMESVHIVEPILLRSVNKARRYLDCNAEHTQGDGGVHDTGPNDLVMVLPAWTGRGQSDSFKLAAQQEIYEHCPAHLNAAYLWLSCSEMATFEALYRAWLTHRASYYFTLDKVDDDICEDENGPKNRPLNSNVNHKAANKLNLLSNKLSEFISKKLKENGENTFDVTLK